MLNCSCGLVCEPRQKLTQSEKYLYKIWLEKDFQLEHLQSLSNKNISIVNPGIRNESEGPDFLKAMIMIDEQLLEGDVEIHIKNNDWYAHGHEKDENYNNVILHVVKDDSDVDFVRTCNGKKIEVLQLQLEEMVKKYEAFPCKNWEPIDFTHFQDVIRDYANNRFQRKTLDARKSLLRYQPEQYFFIGLLDVMGYSKNRQAMKAIAKSLDISLLYKILHEIDEEKRLLFLEATFLGIAGLLDERYRKYYGNEAYFESLRKYWKKISLKHNFFKIIDNKFHFAGSRPANHPHKRLAALAQIINNMFPKMPGQTTLEILFSGRKFESIMEMLHEKYQLPSGMWKNHPLFQSHNSNQLIGNGRLMDFITNVVTPFTRAFSSIMKNEENSQFVIDFNQQVPVGAMPGKIKEMLTHLSIPLSKIKTNYLLQGSIEYHRLFCDLELCNLCILGDRLGHE